MAHWSDEELSHAELEVIRKAKPVERSWFCHQCKVEVRSVGCLFCGKTKGQKR